MPQETLQDNTQFSNIKSDKPSLRVDLIIILFALILFIVCGILSIWILGRINEPVSVGNNSKASLNSPVLASTGTEDKNKGVSYVYLNKGELWVSRNGSTATQFTYTNSSILGFTVDELTNTVYYNTFDRRVTSSEMSALNSIYSCALNSTSCSNNVIYSEAKNVGITDLSISPNGQKLAYNTLTYVDNSFSTNAHILNLSTKQVEEYSKTDFPNTGTPRILSPNWLDNNFLTYNSPVVGEAVSYGLLSDQLSKQNINLGDSGIHYFYSFSNNVKSKTGVTASGTSLEVLSVEDNNALVLASNNQTYFITVVPLSVLTAVNNVDTNTVFLSVQKQSPHLLDSTYTSSQQLSGVFNDGSNIELLFCDLSTCDMKMVSGDYSVVTDLGNVSPIKIILANNSIEYRYSFSNGDKYIDIQSINMGLTVHNSFLLSSKYNLYTNKLLTGLSSNSFDVSVF